MSHLLEDKIKYAIGLCLAGAAAAYISRKAFELKSNSSIESNKNSNINCIINKKRLLTRLIRIPVENIGLVLGRHGKTIRSIEFETKTFLQVVTYGKNDKKKLDCDMDMWGCDKSNEDEMDWFDPVPNTQAEQPKYAFIKIQAYTEEQIDLVQLAIASLTNDAKRHRMTESLKVPIKSLGLIIGKKGVNLRRISESCRVKIQLEHSGEEWESLQITGTPEGIENAKMRLDACIARSMNPIDASGDNGYNGKKYKIEENVNEDLNQLVELGEKLVEEEENWF